MPNRLAMSAPNVVKWLVSFPDIVTLAPAAHNLVGMAATPDVSISSVSP